MGKGKATADEVLLGGLPRLVHNLDDAGLELGDDGGVVLGHAILASQALLWWCRKRGRDGEFLVSYLRVVDHLTGRTPMRQRIKPPTIIIKCVLMPVP